MSAMPRIARIKVLISHGDPLVAAGLVAALRERCDFTAAICSPTETASRVPLAHLSDADIVIADYDSGMRLLTLGVRDLRVVILTHSESEATISHALKQGASGYLMLGCSLEELRDGLRSVHGGGLAIGPRIASRVVDWMQQQALTRREADVLRQMMLGLSNKAIATRLAVTVGTVKAHVKSIFHKLHASSRTEAVSIAHRRGILGESLAPQTQAGRIAIRSDARQPPPIARESCLNSRPVMAAKLS